MRIRPVATFITALLLAACGGAQVAPSVSPRPAVTSRPQTAAPPTPTATVAPTATPIPAATGAAADVIAAFIENFGRKKPPFHVETDVQFTGSAGAHTESGFVSVDGDIEGENFDGEVVVRDQDPVEVRFVDGVAYGRAGGGTWKTLPDFDQTQPLNPFALLDPADVEYAGRRDRDGRVAHELRVSKWVGGKLESPNLSKLELVANALSIFVNEHGIPFECVLDFSITGNAAGYVSRFRFDYHVVYVFSQVGKPVRIKAPV